MEKAFHHVGVGPNCILTLGSEFTGRAELSWASEFGWSGCLSLAGGVLQPNQMGAG